MSIHLFAGIAVSDFAAAVAWYENLFASAPASFPHATEAVWEIAEHRLVYIVERPAQAGHALVTVMVDDLDSRVSAAAERGLQPAMREAYANRARKFTYVDPDGNQIAFGDVPR